MGGFPDVSHDYNIQNQPPQSACFKVLFPKSQSCQCCPVLTHLTGFEERLQAIQKQCSSRLTYVTGLKLDVDENLGVFRLGAPAIYRRAAGLQLTREIVFHPL